MDTPQEPKIGIALSGGGSRAIAFHLGCLRSLNDLGLLSRARVLSTVSGGSVIGALYALHEGPFEIFEERVHSLLRTGLVAPAVRTAFSSPEGLKALISLTLITAWQVAKAPFAIVEFVAKLLGHRQRIVSGEPLLRRFASRTTILRRTLDREVYSGALLGDLAGRRPKWVAVATELRTGSAFYFSPNAVGSWRFGRLEPATVPVAQAVAASAAFPLLLPALDEVLSFERKDGSRAKKRVTLVDGGVYDNLALAPLWPDRDPGVSLDVEEVDTIIACRAGDGLRLGTPSLFFLSRLKASFAAVHERAQNATMKRLFDLRASGRLRAFVLPYLGQVDARLEHAPADLIPRQAVTDYPTDFSPMDPVWIERLSKRGEQLTLALIRQNAPELMDAES